MRHVLVVGIGAGDPDHLTFQAARALEQAHVFFVIDKGQRKEGLERLRREILERALGGRPYQLVRISDPERDRTATAYEHAVADWRRRRADLYAEAIRDKLGEDDCGAFLVWGDPSLYDSTLGILEEILSRGDIEFDYSVIPGISSISALAARHRICLNRIGKPVLITTGRRLENGFPEEIDDVVVMLDAKDTLNQVDGDVEIFWGAYLGMPDEILIAGRAADVSAKILQSRAEARERTGWIMDTSLLRRNTGHRE
jgi:precorrin-6A synthase